MSSNVDRIKPDSLGITTYLENLCRGEYQIPTFQRNVVWDRSKIKRFWDSLRKFYPLGSILVWRTQTRLNNHRKIGGHALPEPQAGQEFHYLLDGQQRTTALLTSMYGGDTTRDPRDARLFVDLTVTDSDEVEDELWRERFLFWDEIDDRGGTLLRHKGRQERFNRGEIVALVDIDRRYDALEERLDELGTDFKHPSRVELRRLRRVFDTYKISFIELRGIEVAEVCQIFERINQAGQPLSMFDIVVAKTYRPESESTSEFYLRGLFEEFRHELQVAGSGYDAIGEMTLLQMLAILVRESLPDAKVQNITDRYLNSLKTEHLEWVWEDGRHAIKKVFDFLDNHLHLPGPALVPYRYFYMSLAAYFFQNRRPDYELLQRYFWYYSFHNDDLLRNTTHLRDHVRRFREVRRGNEFGFDDFVIDRESLRSTRYSSRGRLSRAVLALFARQEPKDWGFPERSVLESVYYTLTDHPNLHHVFPLDFCENNLSEHERRYADSLLNIAYLTQLTNLQISNSNPLVYLQKYGGPRFGEVTRTHLLPDLLAEWAGEVALPDDALEKFVEARLELVLQRLGEYLQGIPFTVVDSRSSSN